MVLQYRVQELNVNAEFVLHAGSDIRTLRETFEAEERTPETKRVVVLSPVVKRRVISSFKPF